MISLHLQLYNLSMRTLKNVPRCTGWLREMGLIFVNNQTVLIWLFYAKTVCGIELCSFNNLLHCTLNPIVSFIDRHAKMSDVTCHDHLIGSRDISWQLCSILGFTLGFMFQL